MIFEHMQGCNSKVSREKSGPETFRLLLCMTTVFILLSGEYQIIIPAYIRPLAN